MSPSSVLTKAGAGRLWAQINKRGWNGPSSKEPYGFPAEVPQRMERLCLRAVAEGAMSEPKAAQLLNISVRRLESKLMGQPA